ncbi:hypothetical protein FB451DRAFT_1558721 [Mycena latifolia]|nr:hypothetical protein FB451DRAFT_1558721 [Mycena latifolia]
MITTVEMCTPHLRRTGRADPAFRISMSAASMTPHGTWQPIIQGSFKIQQDAFPKTFDAYVPSSLLELFALAKLKPAYVAFETLRAIPLDPAHAASSEYAKKITPHFALLHSLWCYYFALAILYNGFPSETSGVPQITFEELNRRLCYTCILHDLGWTTSTPRMHLHAAAPSLDAQQVGDIVQSIVLHTSQWPSGASSATKTLMPLGAIFDVYGYDAQGPGSLDFLFSRKTAQEIEKEYPRGDSAVQGADVLNREFDEKPDCLLSHFPGGASILSRDGFIKAVRLDSLVPMDE